VKLFISLLQTVITIKVYNFLLLWFNYVAQSVTQSHITKCYLNAMY